ncbi:CopG family transcriptional regulator [Sphingomonas colocasiae]|uniref:Ribbon-helix-helix domain-containing protein n=1 Tax=Sphingomonas colocasiae TaxID=1848973 RepID=A0ABS7PIE6_9SPHN|nr:CopG family transcriptional regulator [Sphingomonas colocasiae]MBY8821075.1 ribbon-helix-helix domain-containing protein [Sphingomonas colocasiae]
MRPRHNLYLEPKLSKQLDELARRSNATKSAIVCAALNDYFRRRAGHELDEMFGTRLDRIGGHVGRLQRDVEVLLESLSLLVLHQLTVGPGFGAGDAAAHALGEQGFDRFITEVGRRLARAEKAPGRGGRP